MTEKYAVFTAIPLAGHINPLLRQAEELQRHGWRVAIAAVAQMRRHVASEAPGLPFIDLGEIGKIADALRRDQEAASNDGNFVRGTMRIVRGLSALWPFMFDGLTRAVSIDRPDVMVVDLFSPAGLSVADAQGIPAVVNNPDLLACLPVTMLPPADGIPWLFSGRSIHEVPWYQPFLGPFVRKFAAAFTSLTVEREHNALRKTRKLPPVSVHELLNDRPVLVNGVFGLEYERPLPSRVEMAGPMLPVNVPPLPAELAQWLTGDRPVVYANLGTLVVATGKQLAKMVQAFDSDEFRTLWILKASQSENLPSPLPTSVRLMEWGPMPIAVLAHPNVKAFVSHCGVNSVHESLSTQTPIVGIPMFADQRDMAVRLADTGAGLWLDKIRFNAEDLRAALKRVLNEPSFERNAAKVRESITAAGGTRRAAEVIEETALVGLRTVPKGAKL